jgi:hypothetical protein
MNKNNVPRTGAATKSSSVPDVDDVETIAI